MPYNRRGIIQAMKLFINTGGKGVRLLPLTQDIPKPMVKINGKPILEYLVLWAKKNGITEFVFLNGYKHEVIEDYFKDGRKWGINIIHSNELEPLGSGGSVKNAKKLIDGTFILISGDLICKLNLTKIIEYHNKSKKNGNIMTVVVQKTAHPEDSDLIKFNDKLRITEFLDKKNNLNLKNDNSGHYSNSGLFIIEPEVMNFIDEKKFTFETVIFPKLLLYEKYLSAYIADDVIEDVGTHQRLSKSEEYLKNE